jgi:dethiobiotin synthase
MSIFVTGTDTGVGKTVIAAWLTFHTKKMYFKPIQTGAFERTDRDFVFQLTHCPCLPETYIFNNTVSPYHAAAIERCGINIQSIQLPPKHNVVVEGAGGVFCPIAPNTFMIDLMKQLNIPTIIVARTSLGTINHTCLTIETLRRRQIPIIGVVLNGKKNDQNKEAIQKFGNVPTFEFPELTCLQDLQTILLPQNLVQQLEKYETI